MKEKRFLCLLLATLLLFTLAPAKTEAETTVYFTAVNDQLLPDLSDGTMPFWSGGRLYVPYTAIAGTDLGLFYSRSRDKSTAVVYRQGSALTFDFAAGTVTDQNDRQYSGAAIVRGDVVFLPLDLLTQFFSLDYSYTRVTYGYLVRLKSDTVVLSDAKFIDAAAMSMEQRYNDYMKTHNGSNSADTPPDSDTDNDRNLVCLTLRVTDENVSNALLDTLVKENAKATFLFSEEQLSSLGDLLRAAHRRLRRQRAHAQRDRACKQCPLDGMQRKNTARLPLRHIGRNAARRAQGGLLPHRFRSGLPC